jgi:hypothetical protein
MNFTYRPRRAVLLLGEKQETALLGSYSSQGSLINKNNENVIIKSGVVA